MVASTLAACPGRYSEAMGVAVIVSDEEFGLSVVAIDYLRNGVTESQRRSRSASMSPGAQ